MLKLGSLFDGSGGFPLAGSMCGIVPVWASEIEPYPIAVTRSRFPNMKHFGDISKINGAEVDPVDIITFGSPCQDLSVAGKRAGLKHEANGDEETTRSGLFMEAVRIIKEMREATNGEFPRWLLWENVPGAFSSNKGEDFRVVLEELIKIVEPTAVMPTIPKGGWAYADSYSGAGWSLAYRVFDAQYWGVPQRRRRIHLVLDLRGQRAQEVLFEREGVRGYLATGRAPWQGASANAEGSVGADDREGDSVIAFAQNQRDEVRDLGDKAGALQAEPGMKQQTFIAVPNLLLDDQGGQQITVRTDGKAPTLRAEMHGNIPCVMDVASGGFCPEQSAKTRGIGWEEEKSPTLRAGAVPGVVSAITLEPGIAAREGGHIYEGVAGTLRANAGDNQLAVCVKTWDARGNGDGDTVSTITGDHESRITDYTSVICLQGNGIDRADTAGCNGKGWREDVSYTLNTIDRPAVVYTLSHGGFMVNPSDNGIADTLQATDYKDPQVVAIDRAAFNQGQNAQYDPQFYTDGTTSTLVARGPSAVCYWDGSQTCGTLTANNAGGNQRMPDKENFNCVIEKQPVHYIVRRLTPTECARLQGFPDTWGHIEEKTDFADEEYRFWHEVRNTHAAINGKIVKDYTKAQMLTWYNKLHTDSAEYKMWGNGIALPPALYCMQGIAEATSA